ncbi:MAG: OmpA family protein [Candidatus Fermentibacteraceae bacterium]
MRSKVTLCVVLLLVVSGTATALPSYWGLRGLNRVVDAQPIGINQFAMGVFLHNGISHDERLAVFGDTEFMVEDMEQDVTGYFTMAYGINDMIEIAARVGYVYNGLQRDLDNPMRAANTGEWEEDDGITNAVGTLKAGFNPTADGQFWLGAMPLIGFKVYNGGDSPYVQNYDGYDGIWVLDEPMFRMRRSMIPEAEMYYGVNALMSYNSDFGLGVHGNVGYHLYSQKFEYTDRRFDNDGDVIATQDVNIEVKDNVIVLGFGLEYKTRFVTPFAEADWRIFLDREEMDGNGERYDDLGVATGGFRFTSNFGMALDIVGTMSIRNFDPEWSDLGHDLYQSGQNPTEEERAARAPFPMGYPADYGFGVNLMFSSDLLESPTKGTLSGIVTDATTGELLYAQVSFPATTIMPISTTQGFYTVKLPAGSVPVQVTADGYVPMNETVVIAAGQSITRDFAMQPVPGNGILTGTVTNGETQEILRASISIPDLPAGYDGSTMCDVHGVYSLELPEGTWTLKSEAPGFITVTRRVTVLADQTVIQDIQMRPELVEGQVLVFNNIYFDFDSSNIKPESFSILDNVAQTLLANEGIRVRIVGHTDSDGSNSYNQGLSERRAQSVFNYLVGKGVPASHLSSIGAGEERPIVPNTSPANKAQNRRIEFEILGR